MYGLENSEKNIEGGMGVEGQRTDGGEWIDMIGLFRHMWPPYAEEWNSPATKTM